MRTVGRADGRSGGRTVARADGRTGGRADGRTGEPMSGWRYEPTGGRALVFRCSAVLSSRAPVTIRSLVNSPHMSSWRGDTHGLSFRVVKRAAQFRHNSALGNQTNETRAARHLLSLANDNGNACPDNGVRRLRDMRSVGHLVSYRGSFSVRFSLLSIAHPTYCFN